MWVASKKYLRISHWVAGKEMKGYRSCAIKVKLRKVKLRCRSLSLCKIYIIYRNIKHRCKVRWVKLEICQSNLRVCFRFGPSLCALQLQLATVAIGRPFVEPPFSYLTYPRQHQAAPACHHQGRLLFASSSVFQSVGRVLSQNVQTASIVQFCHQICRICKVSCSQANPWKNHSISSSYKPPPPKWHIWPQTRFCLICISTVADWCPFVVFEPLTLIQLLIISVLGGQCLSFCV